MNPELERILSNVQYMVSEGASEDELNEYLKDEGHTLESLNKAMAPKADGPDLSHLDPFGITKMDPSEFRDKAGRTVQLALGGVGLQGAVKAIRGLQAARAAASAPMVPSPSGLVGAQGNPLMVRGAPVPPRSALDALKLLVKNPWVKTAASAATGAVVGRKLF